MSEGDNIEAAGKSGVVERVTLRHISLRCRLKVQPGKQWRIRSKFLRRVKETMDSREKVNSAG